METFTEEWRVEVAINANTKRKLLRLQSGAQKGSLQCLGSSPLEVSFNTAVVAKGRFWGYRTGESFCRGTELQKKQEEEWKWKGPGEMSDFVERNF